MAHSARLIRLASSRPNNSQDEEYDPLLVADNQDTENGDELHTRSETQHHNPFSDLPIFKTIWRIRHKVTKCINDPYSLEQLRSPRMNTNVVRPLMHELFTLDDISIVFCLLVNKFQFLKEITFQAHSQSVNTSRALLCELLAQKILRQYDETSTGEAGLLLLTHILVCGFDPFENCSSTADVRRPRLSRWRFQDKGGFEFQMSALELAIISESKMFLSTAACQKVVDAIYVGRVVFTPTSFIDIIPDYYKRKPVSIYDPRKAPIFTHHRLFVPRTRKIFEVVQFCILLGFYIAVMIRKNVDKFNAVETVFCVYSFGWILEQFASLLEHGWQVYSQNLWSFLDVTFSGIFIAYFGTRMLGLKRHTHGINQLSFDILSMAAPVMVPRLAFNIFSENLVFLALRDMMTKFFLLTLLVVWTFAGFFLSMLWLGEGYDKPIDIARWMVYVWFGLDGTGIQRSVEFHWLLGPTLMLLFTVLGNTLFLTIVISTLSNSFAKIVQHATAEIQFRRAVLVFEGVKTDVIFAFQPPFNLLALVFLLPLKFVVSPRWFHKINALISKVTNAPFLLLISWYERRTLGDIEDDVRASRQRNVRELISFPNLHPVHGAIAAVFANTPPDEFPDGSKDLSTERLDHAESRDVSGNGKDGADSSSEESSATRRRITRGQLKKRELDPHDDSGRDTLRRRDTVWSQAGLEAQVAGILEDHESGTANVLSRLDALEESSRKIEKMLKRVCDSFDDKADEEAEAQEP